MSCRKEQSDHVAGQRWTEKRGKDAGRLGSFKAKKTKGKEGKEGFRSSCLFPLPFCVSTLFFLSSCANRPSILFLPQTLSHAVRPPTRMDAYVPKSAHGQHSHSISPLHFLVLLQSEVWLDWLGARLSPSFVLQDDGCLTSFTPSRVFSIKHAINRSIRSANCDDQTIQTNKQTNGKPCTHAPPASEKGIRLV